ncbi:MAG: chromosome partitioning protein ParB [Bacteroidetes bacterium]|nr:MAG: chromosome partitioning protein ParB [Bacteroidota bacterium]
MQTIEYIETLNISSSDLNPRKTFDDDSIKELSKSIIEVGILQPIIVRLSHYKKSTETYELICGERRWRAAKLAELATVPAIVRKMTDQEALDLMITENLQRKDVSPLDEAEAFMNLIVHREYDIQSLVTRFAKTESYIRHRLKLNDLIPDFKHLLQLEIIGIGHALEICKIQSNDQQELFNSEYTENKRNTLWWTLPTVKRLKLDIEKSFTLKLKDAAFNINDTTLDEKAGSCLTCTKNTSSNMILFPDATSTGVCLDRSCFNRKKNTHFERELERVQEEDPDVVVAYPGHIYGDDEKNVAAMKKNGVPAVEMSWNSGWREFKAPEMPEMPEESNYDDQEEYQEALAEYKDEMVEFEKDKNEYDEKLTLGEYKKVFMVAGNDKGSIVYMQPTNFKTAAGSDVPDSTDFSAQQIKELEAKDKRNQELTFEKLYNAAKDILNNSGYTSIPEPISEKEEIASLVIMISYASTDLNIDLFGEKNRYNLDNKRKLNQATHLTEDQKARVIRSWLKRNLDTSTPNDLISEAKALIEIAREKYPEELTKADLDLQDKYLKRKGKIDNLIEEIKSKKSEKQA